MAVSDIELEVRLKLAVTSVRQVVNTLIKIESL